jgi:predicted lipopolysaccharide heptosyltransferase III
LTRILLVRLRLLGDVALTTPTIRALRHRFPDAHITYLVEPAAAPVVAANPHLNEVIVVPKRGGLVRVLDDLAMARRLRRGRFDMAIDLHGGPRAAWFAWASRAPMRIGYSIVGRTWMYTHVVGRAAELRARHSVENQADLLGPLGIDGCDPVREPMEMADDVSARERLERRLADAGIGRRDPLVVVHIGAGNRFRQWPAQSFAATSAALVLRNTDLRVILVAGPSDQAAIAAIAQEARAEAGAAGTRVLEGRYDLFELRELIARAAVYIGGDSGPLHVAATTQTPIVALFGATLPEVSRPWRNPRWFTEAVDAGPLPCRPCNQRHCAPGDFRCLTRISTDRVVAATERALQHWDEHRGQSVDGPVMTGSRA